MARYKAHDGVEDRHGEMTGAISVNLALCALPITAWCVYIGPWLFNENLTLTLVTGGLLGLALPFAFLRLSRWIWALLSDWGDRV